MTKTAAIFAALLPLAGCQSFQLSAQGPPRQLDQRLAGIEHARLGATVRCAGAPTAEHEQAIRPNLPPPRSVQLAAARSNAWQRDALDGLTLGDFGDDAYEDRADIEFTEERAGRGDDYVRKPPLDSFWDTVKRDVQDMPTDLWRDTKRVYTNPVNLVILGTAYGGSLAIQELGPDDSVEDHFDGQHHHFKKEWREAFAAAGNPGTHFAMAGAWYLLGQQTQDEKTYEVGKTLFSALIINGLTTLVSQAATWDRSPNGEMGTFFSGHTSSSFCMASVLHEAYGHLVGVPLYGLATLVAIERVEDQEHYFADVIMGAVVGTVIGHSVASGREPEFFGWKLVPYASTNGGAGVAFMKSLP